MSYTRDKLPLEYPPQEMLRIYRDRLLLFSGVVIGNLLILALAIFAISEPVVFSVALTLVAAFCAVCWLTSKDASHVTLDEARPEETLDFATSAKTFSSTFGILWGALTVARGHNQKRSVLISSEPYNLQKILEHVRKFNTEMMGECFQSFVKMYDTSPEKEKFNLLISISEEIDHKIETALQNIRAEDLDKHLIIFGHSKEESDPSWYKIAPWCRPIHPEDLVSFGKEETPFSKLNVVKLYIYRTKELLRDFYSTRDTLLTIGYNISPIVKLMEDLCNTINEIKHN